MPHQIARGVGLMGLVGIYALLAGCAHSPSTVVSHPSLSTPQGSFALTHLSEAAAGAGTRVARDLASLGLVAIDAAAHPDYLVQVTASQRPGKVGALSTTDSSEVLVEEDHSLRRLLQPGVYQMGISIRTASGEEVYAATARRRYLRDRPDRIIASLSEAILAPLAHPQAPSAGSD